MRSNNSVVPALVELADLPVAGIALVELVEVAESDGIAGIVAVGSAFIAADELPPALALFSPEPETNR